MWALYRIDLTDCALPTSVVSSLMEKLAYEPASLARAQALGDESWLYWSIKESLLANIQDNTILTAKSAARQKARLKDGERAYRPEVRKHKATGPVSTDDDAAMMALFSRLG